MTHEQERQLFEAVLSVTRIAMQMAATKREHRKFTERHRKMLADASQNFTTCGQLFAEMAAPDEVGHGG